MAVVRRQRRVQGKKVNYWWCTDTGTEVQPPSRKEHYTTQNALCGRTGVLLLDDAVTDWLRFGLGNFAGTELRNGLCSVSVKRVLKILDTQPVLYSTRHPESPNTPEYDAASTVVYSMLRAVDLPEVDTEVWGVPTGVSIEDVMIQCGYNTANTTGCALQPVYTEFDGARVLLGAEANRYWLKMNGLSPVKRV
ncbi:MAG: hypothetical protein [Caudoviricetes sp.]|nr:MAG: hypothetical protein [Caudoviricetes sp.]